MLRELQIHVEEPSMEAFLTALMPRIAPPDLPWRPINYGSKGQMLARLPHRLAGFARYDSRYRPRVLVLVDRDDDDCVMLKQKLEAACAAAGLATITRPGAQGAFDVVNRIVVEELEAWFFGDGDALEQVWPGVRRPLAKAKLRDPDAIRGGTHQALLRVLHGAGHLRGADRLPKVEVARAMGAILNPARNRSCSFRHFLTGLDALMATA